MKINPNNSLATASDKKTIISHAVIYSFTKAIPSLLGLVTVIIFSRILGSSDFGYYALYSSVLIFATSFSSGWAKQAILRYHVGQQDKILALNSSVYIMLCFICASAAAVMVAVGSYVLGYARALSLIGIVVLMCGASGYALFNLEESRQQAAFRPLVVALIHVIRAGLTLGLGWSAIVYMDLGYIGGILGITLSVILAAAVSIFIGQVEEKETKSEAMEVVSSYWSFGWPVGVWAASMALLPVIDRSMIDWLIGVEAAGVYAAAYEVTVKGYAVFVFPITLALHPHIMSLANSGDLLGARTLVMRGVGYQFTIMMFVALVCYIAGDTIMSKVLGVDYSNGRVLMLLLVIGGGLWQIALVAHKLLEVETQTIRMLMYLMVSILLNLILNFLLLPLLGIVGAAFAACSSATVYLCLVFLHRAGIIYKCKIKRT